LKYFIPSFLYCLYNNLTFVNLSSYDPTTYFLLLQFRVVVTGIVFQILFSKILSRIQWLSLILLTFGCIIKQIGYSKNTKKSESLDLWDYINASFLLILVQVFSSCLAGVYNEYILKEKDNKVDIMLQNVFMYIDSIICNVVLLCLYIPNNGSSKGLIDAFSWSSLSLVFNTTVIFIMVNNACIGIVTSLFLKSLNSILKTFASALELMFTGILSWIIFGIPLDMLTVVSIVIVSLATWLYSKNPVQNPAPILNTNNNNDNNNNSEDILSSRNRLNIV
jgi:solute carrier family 35 (UDP-sugar transporter), member A1/2/3